MFCILPDEFVLDIKPIVVVNKIHFQRCRTVLFNILFVENVRELYAHLRDENYAMFVEVLEITWIRYIVKSTLLFCNKD